MTDQLLMTAILSMDAYNEGYGLNNGPGPTVILPGMGANGTVTQIGSAVIDQNGILSDAATGFYGITYTWNGQTIIDFRGTDNPSPSLTTLGDILGGWVTGAGIIGGQALDAETLYQEVTGQSIFGPTDSNVILTGHSLGGGLAGLIGSLTGDQADVFDNMPYAASAVAAAVAYDISQGATNIAGLFTGQTAGYVYPTFDNVTAEYVDNEALQYIRALAPAAAAAVYSDLGPVVAGAIAGAAAAGQDEQDNLPALSTYGWTDLNPVDYHSAALLTTLIFAQEQGDTAWESVADPVLNACFNDTIGTALGLVSSATATAGVTATGSGSPSVQMFEMIAYSALDGSDGDGGGLVFGDTGIRALFHDADLLGQAATQSAGSQTFAGLEPALAAIAVEFAGLLAADGVAQSDQAGADQDAVDGVFSLSSGANPTLEVDLSPSRWDVSGANGSFQPTSIVGRDTLIDAALGSLPAGQSGLSQAMAWLWGRTSTSIINRLSIAIGDDPLDTTISPPSGDQSGGPVVTLTVGTDGDDVIVADGGNNIIYGGAGDDTLSATSGSNILIAGSGDSTLIGGTGEDVFIGQASTTVDYGYRDVGDGSTAIFGLAAIMGAVQGVAIAAPGGTDIDELYGVGTVTLTDGADDLVVSSAPTTLTSPLVIDAEGAANGFNQLDFSQYAGGVDYEYGALENTSLQFKNFNFFTLGSGNNTFADSTINEQIYLSSGTNLVTDAGAGSEIFVGSGQTSIDYIGDVAVSGLKDTDTITLGGVIPLYGGLQIDNPGSDWATGQGGLVEYGLNQNGDLIISIPWLTHDYTNAQGQVVSAPDEMFILGWAADSTILPDGAQYGPGGITIAAVTITTSLLIRAPPSMSGSIQSQLNFLNAEIETNFGYNPTQRDPLVLDLTGNGFDLTQETSISPIYDINSTLYAVHTGWVLPTDGFLVNDAGGQAQLFGDGSGLNGFAQLSLLDSNGDGVINADDAGFANLKVWVDANQNGVVDPGELQSLSDYGIVAINLTPTPANESIDGNTVTETATFVYANGTTGTIGDISLGVDNVDSTYVGPAITDTTEADAEPDLSAQGTLVTLRQALSLHPELIDQVNTALAGITTPDLPTMEAAILPVLYAWAEGSPIELPNGTIVSGAAESPTANSFPILQSDGTPSDYAWNVQSTPVTIGDGTLNATTWSFISGVTIEVVAAEGQAVPDLTTLSAGRGSASLVNQASDVVNGVTYTQDTYTYSDGTMAIVTLPQGDTLPAVIDAILDGTSGNLSWDTTSGAELAFFERYTGDTLPFSLQPTSTASALQTLNDALADVSTDLGYLAARLVVQSGPLSSVFAGVSFDSASNEFVPNTPNQLAPVFEQLFEKAETQADPIGYLQSWQPLLAIVEADYAQGNAEITNTLGFLAQNIFAAYEAVAPTFDLISAADALGIPSGTIIAGSGDLVGTDNADIFYLSGAAQTAEGGLGADTYVVGQDVGQTVIDDVEPPLEGSNGNVLRFTTLDASDITATRNGADLVLTVNATGDTVTIDNEFTGTTPGLFGGNLATTYGVEEIVFADGTTWQEIDMAQAVARPPPAGGGTSIGTDANDVLIAGTGTDLLEGGGGSDIYEIGRTGGQDTIYDVETDFLRDPTNVLAFGDGITQSELTFTRGPNGDGDLIIGFKDSPQTVTLEGQFTATNTGPFGVIYETQIQLVTFDDGSSLSAQDLMQLTLQGEETSGNDQIYGYETDDTLDGGTGNDFLSGGDGNDTYLIGPGYGNDTIDDNSGNLLSGQDNTVSFKAGITLSDLTFHRAGSSDNLVIDFNNDPNQSLTIVNQFYEDDTIVFGIWRPDLISTFTFADGTTLNYNQVENLTIADDATTGADQLYGTTDPEYFDGLGGNDYEQGGGGGDTFVFNKGYGQLEINEIADITLGNNILVFGPGIAPSDVTGVADKAGDLTLIVGTNGDQVKLDEMLVNSDGPYLLGDEGGVQSIQFADGTVWDRQQILNLALAGTTGNDILYGTSAGEVFDGKGGSDYEQGGFGGDTFVFNPGYGQLEVNEVDGTPGAPSVLQFGAGIDPSNITATVDANGDLILAVGANGDQVTLDGEMGSTLNGVDTVEFADGTQWTRQQLIQLETTGTPTHTTLVGSIGADVFDSNGYATYESGQGGADTFIYNAGYGSLTIWDDNGYSNASTAVLQFGAGITASQLSVSSDANGDLIVTDGISGDQITLQGELGTGPWGSYEYGVISATFADGTSLTRDQLINLETTGAPGKSSLYGTTGADVFDSRGYSTYEQGNGGADTFVYNSGYGALTIQEGNGSGGTSPAVIDFGPGISADQISVTTDTSEDLILTDGVTGDQITILNELGQSTYGSDEYGVASLNFADGTSISRAQLILDVTTGSPTNTALYGSGDADTFDSRGFATYEQGNGGADTFIYNAGYGQLEINESGQFFNITEAVLAFGAGITSADISVKSNDSGQLILLDGTPGDQITIDNQLNSGTSFGIAEATFADGSSLTAQQLELMATTGSAFNRSLYGSPGADLFDSKGFATYEEGRGGADTFVYGAGYGHLEINEDNGSFNASTATLAFGAGISASQIELSTDSAGDLILTDGTSGDQITIDKMLTAGIFGVDEYGVSQVTFADGTNWSRSYIASQIDETSSGPLTLDRGDGSRTIDTPPSTLTIGSGISRGDVILEADNSGDLTVLLEDTGDSITFQGDLSSSNGLQSVLQTLSFSDGSTETIGSGAGDVGAFTWIGSPTNTTLAGTDYGPNTFVLGAGGDSVTGGNNSDGGSGVNTIDFDKGDGAATVNLNGGTGVLDFASDISTNDVLLQADNNGNLLIVLADTGESITFVHALTDQSWGVASALQTINFAYNDAQWSLGTNPNNQPAFTWVGSSTDTTLVGSDYGPNTFMLGAGGDSVTGGNNSDGGSGLNTIDFDQGDGGATVNLNGGTGVLDIASDISPNDVLLQADDNGDLSIVLANTGQSITFDHALTQQGWGVESALQTINFAYNDAQWSLGTNPNNQPAFTWVGSSTDTTLVGSDYGPNTFILGAGGDSVTGGNNSDGGSGLNTIDFDKGDGGATVNLNGGTGVLDLASDISPNDFLLQADNSGDLSIVLADTGASITFDHALTDQSWGVASALQTINIASNGGQRTVGTNSGNEPAFTWVGSSADTTLVGSDYGPNIFELGAGGDTVTGGNNSDGGTGVNTIDFDKGDGGATVNLNSGTGILDIASDISPNDVLLQADNNGNLSIVLEDTGASITFAHALTDQSWGVASALQTINFASNDAQWTVGTNQYNQPSFTWVGTSTDTALVGSDYGPNTFMLGAGGDTVTGGNNSDGGTGVNTIDFDKPDGGSTVNLNGGTGVLDIASDISPSDVLLQADNSGDLSIVLADTGASITFSHDLTEQVWGVASALQTINFEANGASMSIGTNQYNEPSFTYVGSSTDTSLVGSNYGPNTFDLGVGNDSVTGGSGVNNIEFSSQVGNATVSLNGGTNELDFGPAISDQSLWFEQSGNDLQIDVLGTSSTVTISDWFSGSSHQLQEVTAGGLKLDSQISQLISAMATYANDNPGFSASSYTQVPSDSTLQSALTAAWHG